MGSIENIFRLFVDGIWGIFESGSDAVTTGSTIATGVAAEAIGSVENVLGFDN